MKKQQAMHGSAYYKITVEGRLGCQWCDCFEGMTIEPEGGLTNIKGKVADQSALHGLLVRIRDLGLPLISVKRLDQR
jgi:hypothetical protein